MLSFNFIATCILLFSEALTVFGRSIPITSSSIKEEAKRAIAKRAVPAAPRFVIYNDEVVNGGQLPNPSDISGFNVFILAFWLTSGPSDQLAEYVALSSSERASLKSALNDAGIYLMVSAFGSTDSPTSLNPTTVAQDFAAFALQYDFDGVDVDYEDTTAMNSGTAEPWLITFTEALSAAAPNLILTHAPFAPWFTNVQGTFPGGAYVTINSRVGNLIDWYNIQFYNQDDYDDCQTLVEVANSVAYANTAVLQIVASGVPSDKVVLGKPLTSADVSPGSDGFIDLSTLAGCVAEAKDAGWNAGLMFWEYRGVSVAGDVAEVWGSGSSTPPPTGGSGPSNLAPGSNANCATYYTVVSGDTCSKIDSTYGITLTQFLTWNPEVNSGCTNLAVGDAYCVSAPSSTSTAPSNLAPGSSSGCPTYYTVVSGDTCSAIDTKYGITLTQFLSWNTGVNSGCTNLAVGDAYCVAAPTSTGGSTPSNIASGSKTGCVTYYTVVSGDTCSAIDTKYGITLANFLSWNSGVNSGCTNLAVGKAYCVDP